MDRNDDGYLSRSELRQYGDEMYDSAYLGTDGIRAMMDDTAKNYNQHVMGSSSYKAWAGGAVEPPPLPPPTIPVPDESPDGFKGVRVVDSERAVWTIGSARQTLRNGVQAGGGEGSVYKYLSKIVYVSGTDGNWYKWSGAWSSVGPQEPGTVPAPTPEPQPTPTPTPTPCKISAPAQMDIRRNGVSTIDVTLSGISAPVDVRVASGSDGQVTVGPLSLMATPTNPVVRFNVRVKQKSRVITFQSPCGSVAVRVNVV